MPTTRWRAGRASWFPRWSTSSSGSRSIPECCAPAHPDWLRSHPTAGAAAACLDFAACGAHTAGRTHAKERTMRSTRILAAATIAAAASYAAGAVAQESSYTPGTVLQVTGIDLKDGQFEKYMDYL